MRYRQRFKQLHDTVFNAGKKLLLDIQHHTADVVGRKVVVRHLINFGAVVIADFRSHAGHKLRVCKQLLPVFQAGQAKEPVR